VAGLVSLAGVDVSLATVRVFLHLLGVAVWIGGQLVMAALVPLARSMGADAPRQLARRFGQVAWPFYALAVLTGVWNMFSLDFASLEVGYHMTLGLKMLLVAVSGVTAFLHQRTGSPTARAATASLAFVAGLAAMFAGVMLVT
jgi:putative copper export protein